MTAEVKVRRIGSSYGVILPKQVLDLLRVQEGATLTITETPDGVQLSPSDLETTAAMRAFEQVRRQYRDTLRELAK